MSDTQGQKPVHGSCLCGEVAFSIDGTFSPMAHCHCSMCRKIHGAAFATYFNAETLDWKKGETLVTNVESSKGFIRSFCKQCGSVLPMPANHQNNWCIPAGLLDSDPGNRAESHIFVESKAPWFDITDNIKQITEYGDNDKNRVVSRENLAGIAGKQYSGGSCACGKVAFRFKGAAEFMMNCHCTRCRKVKGAAHASNAFVKPDAFEWVRGSDNITVYDLPDAERFGNSFCKDCGSSVPRKSENSPMFNIPAGSLDDAPGVPAKGHIYVGSMAPW